MGNIKLRRNISLWTVGAMKMYKFKKIHSNFPLHHNIVKEMGEMHLQKCSYFSKGCGGVKEVFIYVGHNQWNVARNRGIVFRNNAKTAGHLYKNRVFR